MARRNISKKRFPEKDSIYDSFLVSLLISRILKSGKKSLARNIVYKAFAIIKNKTKKDPLLIFELAVKKSSPRVEVKSRRVGGTTYQVPIEIKPFRATNLSLRWIINYSQKGSLFNGKKMAIRLANEIIKTSKYTSKSPPNQISNTIKKKQEFHRIAETNQAFAHLRY